jgi:hypothetical protein
MGGVSWRGGFGDQVHGRASAGVSWVGNSAFHVTPHTMSALILRVHWRLYNRIYSLNSMSV